MLLKGDLNLLKGTDSDSPSIQNNYEDKNRNKNKNSVKTDLEFKKLSEKERKSSSRKSSFDSGKSPSSGKSER